MTNVSRLVFEKLKCSCKELRLDITLKCGQSFRWKVLEDEKDKIFIGVLEQNLVLLKQDSDYVYYSSPGGKIDPRTLQDYFSLSVDLETLYDSWSKVDPIFSEISTSYPGVRMLRQDPVENLFSFICSANNNIGRIQGMVENMSKEYGEQVGEFNSVPYYAFPTLQRLAQDGVEEKLRTLGFGYRAKYIEESARKILKLGGAPWLQSLRTLENKDAKAQLLTLSGIGPKVADCILLMSLDQPSSVPVDTHVFQIAKQYLPHLNNTKTVTSKVYTEIGDHFRGLYGEYAGWAHSVLFSADLKHLQGLKNQRVEEKKKVVETNVKKESNTKVKKVIKEEFITKNSTNKSTKQKRKSNNNEILPSIKLKKGKK